MTETQKALLELTGHALFGKPTEAVLTPEILKEADAQTVRGIVDKKAYHVFANNVRVIRAHADLEKVLTGIRYTTIKGYASAYYYPEPVRRTMGDVDFLVHPEDLIRANALLREAGYTPDHDTDLHICYRKSGIEFEMHSTVNGVPENDDVIKKLVAEILPTAQSVNLQDGVIRIPDDLHSGLTCILHIIRHMQNGGIGLRHFCDWACFAANAREFEAKCRYAFEQAGLWQCARLFSLAAVRYLGMPYWEWMGQADSEVIDALMEEVMSSGNFGRAREESEMTWFVNKKGKGSRLAGLLGTLSSVTQAHWPISKRVPVLLPVGWVFFSVRYVVRMLLGKRKAFDLGKVLSAAENKNVMLRELKLFER